MKNGQFWYDTDGNMIHAHGGWMLKVGDYYYWYGEDRTGLNFVSCYRTRDFKSFEFRRHVLTADSPVEASYLCNADLALKAVENDDANWSEAAEAAGMTVDQFKVFQDMKRKYEAAMRREQLRAVRDGADQQMKAWEQEAESLKELYPSFSLETEVQNPRFLAMLKANVSMDAAYRALHMDEIMEAERKQTAQLTQQQVVASIRAKGTRPSENGTSGQSGFTIKDDVSKLSKKDRAEVARQVKQGKMISF